MRAELRDGQRNRDEPGLQRGVESDDVIQALRRKDRGTITRRANGAISAASSLHAAVISDHVSV